MNRYEDAMFMQSELLRGTNTPQGFRYYETYERAMRDKEYDDDVFDTLPRGIVRATVQATMQQADPVYVSAEMAEVIQFAAESFQPETVTATDLFTACGFAYMAKPLMQIDVHGGTLPIRAISWIPIGSDTIAQEDPETQELSEGGLWMSYFTHVDDDLALGRCNDEQASLMRRRLGHLTIVHSFFMPYDQRAWETIKNDRYLAAARRQWALAQVLWRLAMQVVRSVKVAPRATRRDARRSGLDRDDVTVIQLRKEHHAVVDPSFNDSESEGEHYHVKFVVRGHWRNQWYPSVGRHRQIWITPYVKGPDWAPLKLTTRVFELVR